MFKTGTCFEVKVGFFHIHLLLLFDKISIKNPSFLSHSILASIFFLGGLADSWRIDDDAGGTFSLCCY